jgi:hypothetical protein
MISVIPPMPGAPGSFLTSDPYQTQLDVHRPEPDDEYIDDSQGVSDFGKFGSPEFATRGFGAGTTVQDERIGRRGAADASREEEWNFDELDKEGVDIQECKRWVGEGVQC